jgi:5-methylcytosine-specific restriction endonuclease McrA
VASLADKWAGGYVVKARAYCQRVHGFTCWICGHLIVDADDYSVDHVIERSVRPDLTFDPSNWRPAHRRKHPELNCPGNAGRTARKQGQQPVTQTWSAPGW